MERISDQLYRILMSIYQRYANRFLPRWYVFVFDAFIIFTTFFVAYAMRLNFQLSEMRFDVVSGKAAFTTLIYALFMLVFRSFSGVLRHTGFNEIARVLKATGSALGLLLTLCIVRDIFSVSVPFLSGYGVFLIHFLLAFFVLTGSRLIIKTIFFRIVKANARMKRSVIIFGAGSAGMVTLGALKQDLTLDYHVAAFVDDNHTKAGKTLDGVPVMLPDHALTHAFVEQHNICLFIIAVLNLGVERRRELIEKALELQVEVRVMPPVRDWINGRLSATQLRRARIEELLARPPIKLGVEHVARDLEGKVVLITGAAGSIGSELARQAITYNPKKLILLDQAESALYELQFEMNQSPELKPFVHLAEYFIGNVRDLQRVEKLFSTFGPQVVYHAAAYKHVPLMEENPYEAVCVNVMGTRTLADLAVKYGAEKFVMISTDKAVNPTNVMGATKRIAEIYVQSFENVSTQFVTTRFGNVLDSNGSVIPLFQKQIEHGGPITITHPEITRFFMMIPEACSLVLEAGTMGKGNEIFVFDMGQPVRIYDLARRMIQLAGLTPGKDIKIEVVGLRPGEKLYEELLCNSENTLPTHHPKIMRAKVAVYSRQEVINHIKDLEKALQSNNDFELVARMKKMVPEFISNNSVFEALDNNNQTPGQKA